MNGSKEETVLARRVLSAFAIVGGCGNGRQEESEQTVSGTES